MNNYELLMEYNKILQLEVEKLNHYKTLYNVLKDRNDKAIEKLTLLIDIGFDYDGYNDIENLKRLIDELVSYVRESRKILEGESNE